MKVKSVVITGCTRGLGRALAGWFAVRKIQVNGCGRSKKGIAEVAKEFPAPHRFEILDVSDRSAVDWWASSVLKSSGAPDLLINNAAVTAANGAFWDVPAKDFDEVIDVNIKGLANVTRAFLPTMIAKRRGVVVNISSGWGRSTSPEVAAYCASKWAVEGFTQALAQELPAGLAALTVNPGIISTDMLAICFGEAAKDYPTPDEWVRNAGPFLEELGVEDNGKALTVPGIPV